MKQSPLLLIGTLRIRAAPPAVMQAQLKRPTHWLPSVVQVASSVVRQRIPDSGGKGAVPQLAVHEREAVVRQQHLIDAPLHSAGLPATEVFLIQQYVSLPTPAPALFLNH